MNWPWNDGIDVLDGRGLRPDEIENAAEVALVSASLASRLWPQKSALGKRIRFGRGPDHVPLLAGDTGMRRAGTAYCIAYMRALLRRANKEVG